MRHSIRLKISLMIFACVVCMVGLIIACNTLLFSNFYLKDRTNNFEKSYNQVNEALGQYDNGTISQDEFEKNLERMSATNNISMMILDENWEIFYASMRDPNEFVKHLQKSLFTAILFEEEDRFKEKQDVKQVVKHDEYSIYSIYNNRMDDRYLELIGNTADGRMIYMSLAVRSIEENVSISNHFIIYVGLAVALVAAILAYGMGSVIAKPIRDLSHIAEQMSNLDFDVAYESNDKSEVGVLGNSMNKLSGALKQTITELKSANVELQKDIETKEQVDVMRKEFISNVSHELKTPIALIQGYAEGLKEGISDDEESRDFYCEVIMDEANKMNHMVKQLLSLNQLEFGENPLEVERFDLLDVIQGVVQSKKLLAQQKGIDIQVNVGDLDHVPVWADEYKIEEVVTNYLTNAINHCDDKKQIEVNVTMENGRARVGVINSGLPIPTEDLEHIWEKFYKVDKARTREYGGTGIGLSIVKAIMEQHHQNYGVRNLAEGVEFWFELDAKVDIEASC